MQTLKAHGPEVIEHRADGRKVFLRCKVDHKGQTGMLEVRDDGLSFVGEIALEIPWSTVVHVAKTTHKDSDAIAIQEGKRARRRNLVSMGEALSTPEKSSSKRGSG